MGPRREVIRLSARAARSIGAVILLVAASLGSPAAAVHGIVGNPPYCGNGIPVQDGICRADARLEATVARLPHGGDGIPDATSALWDAAGMIYDVLWRDVIAPSDDTAWAVLGYADDLAWGILRGLDDGFWAAVGGTWGGVTGYAGGIEHGAWTAATPSWGVATEAAWDEHSKDQVVSDVIKHFSSPPAGQQDAEGAPDLRLPGPALAGPQQDAAGGPVTKPVALIVHGWRNEDMGGSYEVLRDFLAEGGDWQEVRRVGYYGAECEVEDRADHFGGHDVWFGEGEHVDLDGCEGWLIPGRVHDLDTDLRHLAYHLAWLIHERYTKKGIAVDIVAHSMGGILVRYMMGHVGRTSVFPETLLVEDVVTTGSPHWGPVGWACGNFWDESVRQMCSKRRPGMMWWMDRFAHQGDLLGEWTLIGSTNDEIVRWESAMHMTVGSRHKWVFFEPYYHHGEWLDDSRAGDATLFYNDLEPDGSEELEVTLESRGARLIHKALTRSDY